MKKARWVLHLLGKSLRGQGAKPLLSLAALALVAGLATALVALSLGVRERLGEELRAYGANLVILPEVPVGGGEEIAPGSRVGASYLQEEEIRALMAGLGEAVAAYELKFDTPGKVSAVRVCARADRVSLDALAARMRRAVPGIEVRTVQQVAQAEENLSRKVQGLMFLVTLSVLGMAGISVGATVGTTLLERRQEIGLLKALGASGSMVRVYLLMEIAAISLAGGLLGCLGGLLLAELIARSVFAGGETLISWSLLGVALGTGLGVGVLASLGPVRSALKADPALALKEL